jgi:tetratricopeptide (TPR) repeat protein
VPKPLRYVHVQNPQPSLDFYAEVKDLVKRIDPERGVVVFWLGKGTQGASDRLYTGHRSGCLRGGPLRYCRAMHEGTEEAARLIAGGENDEAERVLLGLLEKNPEDARTNYLMASLCDQRGQEREAVPFYRRTLAAAQEPPEEDLVGTYLGLGSTYRVLGEYEDSRRVLREGLKRFPADRALSTFLALTLYNLGECREATSTLLKNLVETSNDPGIRLYGRALAHYADRLDETLE